MAGRTVSIEIYQDGDPVTGVWCDECALPSAITVNAVLIFAESGRECGRASSTVCVDCGWHPDEEEGAA